MSRIRRRTTIRFRSGRHAFTLIDYEKRDIDERANGPDADEVEQRSLHAEIREGLVQALEDPIASRVVRVCLHRRPLTLVET